MKQMPDLSSFTGTRNYWRWYPGSAVFLTDGVKYVIDELGVPWLISKVEYFLTKKSTRTQFPVEVKLDANQKGDALLTLQNDNGTYGKRKFPSVNFPPEGLSLFACPYDGKWIIMLPSEY